VVGDIPFYQHSVPDGTSNAATLPQINYELQIKKRKFDAVNYKLQTNGTSNAATCPLKDKMLVENSIETNNRPVRDGMYLFFR
jgi:hypothetical protein